MDLAGRRIQQDFSETRLPVVVSMQCSEAQGGTPGWPKIAEVVTAAL
jgi:hypothetical protein